MSVPRYRRKESSTEFIKELYELNIRCGQIVMKQPCKYRKNYGDHLIKECLQALTCVQKANAIYVSETTPQYLMDRRCMLFHEAIEICTSIPTTSYIFLELTKNCDGFKGDCVKSEMFFAEKCDKICSLLKGVIKKDLKRYNEYQQNKL